MPKFIVALLLLLASVAAPVTLVSAATGPTNCPNEVNGRSFPAGTTIQGNLVVPPGIVCYLFNVTVTGNLIVQPGADYLFTFGNTEIKGNVTGTGARSVVMQNATVIKGNVRLQGITDVAQLCCEIDVGGLTEITGSNSANLFSGRLRGSVTLNNNGFLQVSDNRIDGKLSCSGNGTVATGGTLNTVKGGKFGQCVVR